MSITWSHGVVVGVDGSDESYHAFGWALAAADRHDARLTLSHAEVIPVGPITPVPAYDPGAIQETTEALLRHALERSGPRPDGATPVDASGSTGTPASVLVLQSRDAALVVVGRRGTGRTHRILGSVSAATAAHAHGPVAVVPAGSTGTAPARVVVGVGFDDDPTTALDLAFSEADRSGSPVALVHAIQPATQVARESGSGDPPEIHQALRGLLDRWSGRYPGVTCEVDARPGVAAEVLLEHATPDDLLVVGGRRHSRLAGRLLGSVPDALLADAPCVVAVAHTPRTVSEPV
ncbi:universal stress protein [Isoptericola sp. BMS4]|uniref:universal stress protein n=1 Tax=Isoptericola sp. BMS4 TaxID=2527875 RepID=UPI0014210A2F|nr:universal stress protein [Isoptericola sp. BMS4]